MAILDQHIVCPFINNGRFGCDIFNIFDIGLCSRCLNIVKGFFYFPFTDLIHQCRHFNCIVKINDHLCFYLMIFRISDSKNYSFYIDHICF